MTTIGHTLRTMSSPDAAASPRAAAVGVLASTPKSVAAPADAVVKGTAINGSLGDGPKAGGLRKILLGAAGLLIIGGITFAVLSRRQRRLAHLAAAVLSAVQDGNDKQLQALLFTEQAPPEGPDDSLGAPLRVAVNLGNANAVAALLAAGACPNGPPISSDAETGDSAPPLVAAAAAGRAEIVTALLGAGADVGACDGAGFTAAHIAAQMGRVPVLRALFAASPSAADAPRATDGCRPLMLAAAGNHVSAASWLLTSAGVEASAGMTMTGVTALHAAAKDDHADVIAAIIAACRAREAAAAGSAASAGTAAAAAAHAFRGAALDVDAPALDGRSPLAVAARHNSLRAAEVLLDAGASVHGHSHAAAAVQPPAAVLAQAAAESGGSGDGSDGVAAGEVPQGQQAPPLSLSAWAWDAGEGIPIIAAARRGHAPMVRLLAARGADVDAALPDGRSLLLALVDGVPVPGSSQATAAGGAGTGVFTDASAAGGSDQHAFKGARVRHAIIEALLQLGADPHALSMERAAATRGRRDSFVTRRTAATTVRACGDARLQALFDGAISNTDSRNGSMIAGGEP